MAPKDADAIAPDGSLETAAPLASREERELVARLRSGDEAAFVALVDRHGRAMLRLARTFVSTEASAQEVVQDTWAAVLDGLVGFEARSSLKTWMFRILVNKAKTRGVRDRRSTPMSSLEEGDDADAPPLSADRFDDRGRWSSPPRPWDESSPEGLLMRKEAAGLLREALLRLPDRQRLIVTLRDVEGWTAEEVCSVLELTETNQRVLLHRARSRLRALLEEHLAER
jgi:RNA polymerase sigma-70 factor, ECF subfamily